MNATYFDNDRSSTRVYEADRGYRAFLKEVGLQPMREYSFYSDSTVKRPWTHIQSTATTSSSGNIIYTTGRIDDILVASKLAEAESCPHPTPVTMAIKVIMFPS